MPDARRLRRHSTLIPVRLRRKHRERRYRCARDRQPVAGSGPQRAGGQWPGAGGAPDTYRRAIFSVPIDVVVAVGQAQPVIGELLAMRRDTVLPLSSRVDDPVQIMVGDRVIARGELEELGEDGSRLGVRLTEVVDVSDLF
ncbi:MAG: FliM/FliN family flagellar motor switch protein [Pseudomonadota bacterium]